MIYTMSTLKCKIFAQMAGKRHFQVYLSSKKPRISVKTVSEKQNRNMDLQLELLETVMSR